MENENGNSQTQSAELLIMDQYVCTQQTIAPKISAITEEPVYIGPSDQQVIPTGAVISCEKIAYGGDRGGCL